MDVIVAKGGMRVAPGARMFDNGIGA